MGRTENGAAVVEAVSVLQGGLFVGALTLALAALAGFFLFTRGQFLHLDGMTSISSTHGRLQNGKHMIILADTGQNVQYPPISQRIGIHILNRAD